jgi:hypothetical protein
MLSAKRRGMEPTQAQAEATPTTAATETAADTTQPTLENANLDDLDSVQTEAAKVTPKSEEAGSGAEGETPAETPAPEGEPPQEGEPEGTPPADEPEEPRGELPNRFRYTDPTDKAINAVYKAAQVANAPITWAEAERRVKGEQPPAQAATAPPPDPLTAQLTTVETLKNEITLLEQQIDPEDEEEILSTKAMRSATVQLADKRAQLSKEELKLEGIQYAVEGERQKEVTAQKNAREESKGRAIEQFPDAADSKTVLGKAIAKRFEEMKDPRHPEHPILYADTAPERVTEIVARELGIAPKATAKPAQKTTTAPTQKKATPVSGAKTAVPGKPAESTDDKTSVEYLRSDKATLADLDNAAKANEGIAAAVR